MPRMGGGHGIHSQQNSRKKLLFAASILSLCFLLSQGQAGTIPVMVEPPMPREGDTVTLKPGTIPENSVTCRWYRGEAADANVIVIFFFFPSPGEEKGPAYTGRETVDSSCSLQITDLKSNYSGTYRLSFDGPGITATGSANITVIEKLSQPILSPANYVALENENITLYCNISSGNAFNISWYRNSGPVSPEADISENKKNLTLRNFTNADAGIYTCVASNQLSSETSNPSSITLAYGPVDIKVEPAGVITLKLASKLDLLCTADSNPAAQFQWFINGTVQHVTNNRFSVDSVAWKDGGNYTCQANNTVTKNHALVSVIVKVTNQGPSLSSPGGLGGGAIAGIVLGSLAVTLALTGTLFYFFCRGRHQNVKTDSPVIIAPNLYENILPSGPVRTGANPESSSGTSQTYETLQFRDQAVYQEIK
nr:carcinoembryonic antigen-related cell adhesion molecule 6-like isoform X1 [Pogona vitticeps]